MVDLDGSGGKSSGASVRTLDAAREAARAFERRWTMETLERVNAGLCEAVREQIELLRQAQAGENEAEVVLHGEAMVRGWVAATMS